MPLRTVRDDVIVSRRGELTIGWALTLPVADSLSEGEYDARIQRYCEAAKRRPPSGRIPEAAVGSATRREVAQELPPGQLGPSLRLARESHAPRLPLAHRLGEGVPVAQGT